MIAGERLVDQGEFCYRRNVWNVWSLREGLVMEEECSLIPLGIGLLAPFLNEMNEDAGFQSSIFRVLIGLGAVGCFLHSGAVARVLEPGGFPRMTSHSSRLHAVVCGGIEEAGY